MDTNTQLREDKVRGVQAESGTVDIVQVFETIQGEGPYVGMPAVFIRTAGCNLQCAYCDTDYTSNRRRMSVTSLLEQVMTIRSTGLVVITGGEPFRQDINPLCCALLRAGYIVQIETNGTFFLERFPYDGVCIVCSPKTPTVHQKLQPFVDDLKYLLAADSVNPYDGLPTKVLGSPYSIARPWEGFSGGIWIQPEDHYDSFRNAANRKAAVASCLKYGYRMCLQTHKLLGLD